MGTARYSVPRIVDNPWTFLRDRFLNVLSNTDIAELLAQQAERETGVVARAFRRAARAAFLSARKLGRACGAKPLPN